MSHSFHYLTNTISNLSYIIQTAIIACCSESLTTRWPSSPMITSSSNWPYPAFGDMSECLSLPTVILFEKSLEELIGRETVERVWGVVWWSDAVWIEELPIVAKPLDKVVVSSDFVPFLSITSSSLYALLIYTVLSLACRCKRGGPGATRLPRKYLSQHFIGRNARRDLWIKRTSDPFSSVPCKIGVWIYILAL